MYLKRNKAAYDHARKEEWDERKDMRHEDEKLREMFLNQQTEKEKQRAEEEATEVREQELNEKWKKYMLE